MGFRSGEFAGQSSTQHHGHLTSFWCFGSVGMCQILLEKEISIFKKLQNVLVNGAVTLVLKKQEFVFMTEAIAVQQNDSYRTKKHR